jgi:hypothetical protein
MWQDEALRLDALCIALAESRDRPLGRSALMNRLVEEAYNSLPAATRENATNIARQHINHLRRPAETAAE